MTSTTLIDVHDFRAVPWWERCAVPGCGLSMAAHGDIFLSTRIAINAASQVTNYRCPACVTASEYDNPEPHAGHCPHPGESA